MNCWLKMRAMVKPLVMEVRLVPSSDVFSTQPPHEYWYQSSHGSALRSREKSMSRPSARSVSVSTGM